METPGHGKLGVVGVGPDVLLDLKHGQKPVIGNGRVVTCGVGSSCEPTEETVYGDDLLSDLVSSQTSGEVWL
jgi:hypothetical protein